MKRALAAAARSFDLLDRWWTRPASQRKLANLLLVLVSLRYSTADHIVFRYLGFAVATVLVRLALAAPHYYDAAIGIGAALFAVTLTLVFSAAADTFATST